jgi:cation transport ATPase
MKNSKIIITFIAVASIFASCKNSMDLTKRHYTKGYYFHKTKSLETPVAKESVATVTEIKSIELEAKTPSLTKSSNHELKGGIKENELITGMSNQKHNKEDNHSQIKTSSSEQLQSEKVVNTAQKKNSRKQRAGGDKDMIYLALMVILCIIPFICLIPVYLHDDKDVTMNFWITLLLHLTVIGYIVFSILVVFDVVDLA